MAGATERPFTTAQFQLAVDGLAVGDFSECTGLTTEVGTEEYAEGGENRFTHRFPARLAASNLVFKRGTTSTGALFEWYDEYRSTGMVAPRSGSVTLLMMKDGAPAPIKAWAFHRGYPVKFAGPDLNATSAAVAVETVEILHHGLAEVGVPL